VVKLVVAYRTPVDRDKFEDLYVHQHRPLAAQIPHVKSASRGVVTTLPGDKAVAYYRIGELLFESEDDLNAAMASTAGKAAVANAREIGTGGVDFMVVHLGT
jgi:uncharacterized protein (TIGR02118 family)